MKLKEFIGSLLLVYILHTVGFSQIPLSELDFNALGDSCKHIKIYQPTEVYEYTNSNHEFDFAEIDHGCAKWVRVSNNEERISIDNALIYKDLHVRPGKSVHNYGMKFQHIFGLDHPVYVRFEKPLALMQFPGKEGAQLKTKTDASFSLEYKQASSFWKKIMDKSNTESLFFKININSLAEIQFQRKINFPYGQRLSYPLETTYQLEILSIAKDDQFENKIPKRLWQSVYYDLVTYIDIFNSYKGIWLAQLILKDYVVQSMDIFEQANYPLNARICKEQDDIFQLYPNPSYGNVKLLINEKSEGTYILQIYNIIGQKILRKEIPSTSGLNITNVNLQELSKGSYLYALIDPNGKKIFTKRLNILGY